MAIVSATGALGPHARGVLAPDRTFENWAEFTKTLRDRFCPTTWDFNVAWRLDKLRMKN